MLKVMLPNHGEMRLGDRFVCHSSHPAYPIKSGMKIEIKTIDDVGDEYEIGVACDTPLADGHDLNGMVPNPFGYFIGAEFIVERCNRTGSASDATYYISTNGAGMIHKGQDLEGMPCRIVGMGSNDAVVEFEENIKGSSGDGMGKSGHCLLVHTSLLSEKKPGNADKKEEPKKEEAVKEQPPLKTINV